jgi:hypothetical protein
MSTISRRMTLTIESCVDNDGGYWVRLEFDDGNVFPATWKATAAEALARAAQLYDLIEPITPQAYPELVRIGAVVTGSQTETER